MLVLKLALRNIFRHATRSLITLGAIAFGGGALIIADGFFNDLFFKLRESSIRQRSGHWQIHRPGYMEKGAATPFNYLISDTDAFVDSLKKLPETESVSLRLMLTGLLGDGESSVAVHAVSIDPEKERIVRKENKRSKITAGSLVAGEPLESGDERSVLLGEGLAKSLSVEPGAGLVLLTNTVDGSVNAADVVYRGAFQTAAKEFDDNTLRLPLSTAQNLLRTDGVQTIVVVLKDTEDTDAVGVKIRKLIAEQKLDLEAVAWPALNEAYLKTRGLFGRFFFILSSIIAVVVTLSILNTMNMAVIERTSEIGTLRAIGHRRAEIVTLFVIEGFILGVVGAICGIGFGALATYILGQIGIPMPPPPGTTASWVSEPALTGNALILAAIISIASAVFSSVSPARKASRLEIAEALRHVS